MKASREFDSKEIEECFPDEFDWQCLMECVPTWVKLWAKGLYQAAKVGHMLKLGISDISS